MRLTPEEINKHAERALDIPHYHTYLKTLEAVKGHIGRSLNTLLKKQIRLPDEERQLNDLHIEDEIVDVKIEAIKEALNNMPDEQPNEAPDQERESGDAGGAGDVREEPGV